MGVFSVAASKLTKIIIVYGHLALYTIPMYFHVLLLLLTALGGELFPLFR